MINDLAPLLTGHTTAPSAGGFGHPTCDATATTITGQLPTKFPIGKNP
jgi:hypothetical protein